MQNITAFRFAHFVIISKATTIDSVVSWWFSSDLANTFQASAQRRSVQSQSAPWWGGAGSERAASHLDLSQVSPKQRADRRKLHPTSQSCIKNNSSRCTRRSLQPSQTDPWARAAFCNKENPKPPWGLPSLTPPGTATRWMRDPEQGYWAMLSFMGSRYVFSPQWKLAAKIFIARILRQPGHKNNLCSDACWVLLTMLFAQPSSAEREHPVLGW